jgi:mannose-1-phosphate guanylyltransferase/mannose-6-phosphate isomerase
MTPVILSGGSGTRLWPLSRALYPKQFVSGLNGQDESLLANTLTRLAPESGFAAPVVVCNNAHRFLVQEHAARAGVAPDTIVLEPVARNTAPAIAVAALLAAQRDPGTVLVVLPSDQIISDTPRFRDAVRRATEVAALGRIVLFGITPTEPHTGYGYIRKGAPLSEGHGEAMEVAGFFEKPNAETAAKYFEDGGYFWNSGMFVFRADMLIDELRHLAPAVLEAAREALAKATTDLGFLRLDETAYAKAPNVSIDYAVMEKTSKALVLPLSIEWGDLGSWGSLWDTASRDETGNFIQGNAVIADTENCYIRSERALIATLGVKDLVIVETPDAVLVADKLRSQEVGALVSRLKAENRKEQEQHLRSYRPWGFFDSLNIGPRFQVKLLHVKPGGILSMQMHHHRSEHWVVVRGTARVTIDGEQRLVQENESVYIKATHWHRLENPGRVPLELIEVQLGSYLGEDDIIRADDEYHRAPNETK